MKFVYEVDEKTYQNLIMAGYFSYLSSEEKYKTKF